MINYEDQMRLFRIISTNIKHDIEAFAFGGTAMMFMGIKEETKDIDLSFEIPEHRSYFLEAIERMGFKEYSPIKIYIEEKLRDKNRPLIYTRDDIRFDLFVKKIFKTQISPKMKEDLFAIHEFREKFNLKIKVLNSEHIVLLKGITERQNDFEDIQKILEKDKNFKWQYLIDEVIWQHNNGDSWVLLDIERTLKELSKYVFIEKKYFGQIYEALKNKL